MGGLVQPRELRFTSRLLSAHRCQTACRGFPCSILQDASYWGAATRPLLPARVSSHLTWSGPSCTPQLWGRSEVCPDSQSCLYNGLAGGQKGISYHAIRCVVESGKEGHSCFQGRKCSKLGAELCGTTGRIPTRSLKWRDNCFVQRWSHAREQTSAS